MSSKVIATSGDLKEYLWTLESPPAMVSLASLLVNLDPILDKNPPDESLGDVPNDDPYDP